MVTKKSNIFKKIIRNKRLLIMTIAVIVLIIGGVTLIITSLTKGNKKEVADNLSNVVKDQEVEGLKFSNSKIEFVEGRTNFITTVTNVSGEKKTIEMFDAYVYDEKDNLLIKFSAYVGKELVKGESKEVTCLIDKDLHNAYRVEYKVPS